MSKLKQLVEKANQKNEMRWRVYAYDPAKDNELVHTSKVFDDINGAGIEKAEYLKKHPEHTVEIISETVRVKTTFGSGHKTVDNTYKNDKDAVDAIKNTIVDGSKGTKVIAVVESSSDLTVAKAMANNNISKDKRIVSMINALEKDIKNAKTDKERKELKELLAKLKEKSRLESSQKNEVAMQQYVLYVDNDKSGKDNSYVYNDLNSAKRDALAYEKQGYKTKIKSIFRTESAQKNEGVHFGQPNVDKCYNELMDISFQEMKKRNGKELSDKEFEAFRPMLLKKYPKEVVDYCYMKANESAQKNEGIKKPASKMPYRVTTNGADGKSLEFQYATLDKAKKDAEAFRKNGGTAIIKFSYTDENDKVHTEIINESSQKNETKHSKDFTKNIYTTLEKVSKAILKVTDSDYRKSQQTLGYAAICLAALQNYVNHVGQSTDEWLADHPTEADKYYKQAIDAANKL